MELYKFGSYLHGESHDKDVVIFNKKVPQLEGYDLHVLHPETFEVLYPETARKIPNLFKVCIVYDSEVPEGLKEKIKATIDWHEFKREIFVSMQTGFTLFFNATKPNLVRKGFFKIMQAWAFCQYYADVIELTEKLFYKSGLIETLEMKGVDDFMLKDDTSSFSKVIDEINELDFSVDDALLYFGLKIPAEYYVEKYRYDVKIFVVRPKITNEFYVINFIGRNVFSTEPIRIEEYDRTWWG